MTSGTDADAREVTFTLTEAEYEDLRNGFETELRTAIHEDAPAADVRAYASVWTQIRSQVDDVSYNMFVETDEYEVTLTLSQQMETNLARVIAHRTQHHMVSNNITGANRCFALWAVITEEFDHLAFADALRADVPNETESDDTETTTSTESTTDTTSDQTTGTVTTEPVDESATTAAEGMPNPTPTNATRSETATMAANETGVDEQVDGVTAEDIAGDATETTEESESFTFDHEETTTESEPDAE